MSNQAKVLRHLPLWLLMLGFISHYILPIRIQVITDAILLAAVYAHSAKLWGVKQTILYLIPAIVIGYSAESIGINTGLVFGRYHYNHTQNWGMLFGVPIAIPMLYAVLLYAANFMFIAISKKFLVKKNLWALAIMTGALLMLKDLATDPLQSTVSHHWMWERSGEYFGVPLHNFIGWFGVFVLITLVSVPLGWYKHDLNTKIHIDKTILCFPILLFFTLAFFGFTSAITVPEIFRHIGQVSAFILVFVLAPYILLAWFLGCKDDTPKIFHF